MDIKAGADVACEFRMGAWRGQRRNEASMQRIYVPKGAVRYKYWENI